MNSKEICGKVTNHGETTAKNKELLYFREIVLHLSNVATTLCMQLDTLLNDERVSANGIPCDLSDAMVQGSLREWPKRVHTLSTILQEVDSYLRHINHHPRAEIDTPLTIVKSLSAIKQAGLLQTFQEVSSAAASDRIENEKTEVSTFVDKVEQKEEGQNQLCDKSNEGENLRQKFQKMISLRDDEISQLKLKINSEMNEKNKLNSWLQELTTLYQEQEGACFNLNGVEIEQVLKVEKLKEAISQVRSHQDALAKMKDMYQKMEEERNVLLDQTEKGMKTAEEWKEHQKILEEKSKINENKLLVTKRQLEHFQKVSELLAEKIKSKTLKIELLLDERTKLHKHANDLQNTCQRLKMESDQYHSELDKLRVEYLQVKEDRNVLIAVTDGHLDSQNQEISKLLNRLRRSETDLALAKKVIKTKAQIDKKASKVAGSLQDQVTNQRSQVDKLQSRVKWLEEALTSAEKEKERKNLVITELKQQLKTALAGQKRFRNTDLWHGSENHVLIQTLKSALEEAATKYANLQESQKQQLEEWRRERLQFLRQIKRLEKHGETDTQSRLVPMSKISLRDKLTKVDTAVKPSTAAMEITSKSHDEKQNLENGDKRLPFSGMKHAANEIKNILSQFGINLFATDEDDRNHINVKLLVDSPAKDQQIKLDVSSQEIMNEQNVESLRKVSFDLPQDVRCYPDAPEKENLSRVKGFACSSPKDSDVVENTHSNQVAHLIGDHHISSLLAESSITETTEGDTIQRLSSKLENLRRLGEHISLQNQEAVHTFQLQRERLEKVKNLGMMPP